MSPEVETFLEKLYDRVPAMECKGLCAEEFCGPIAMSEPERLRILDRVGHPPSSRIFARIDQPLDLARREAFSMRGGKGCLRCPMLENGRCRVYDIRPMICRIWGATRDMACPHGCRPTKWLSHAEWTAMLKMTHNL